MSRSPESSLTNAPTPEGVFRGVAADDWQTWLAQGEILSLGAGDVLFQEGDPGDAVYLVIDGHLQIRVTRPDGSVIVLADAQRGDLVGEHYLFLSQAGGRRGSAVQASQSSRLLRWSGQAFLDFVLAQYVKVGVDELAQEKLKDLLKLKYEAIADAVAALSPGNKSTATLPAPTPPVVLNSNRRTTPRKLVIVTSSPSWNDPLSPITSKTRLSLRVWNQKS